MLFNSIEFLVFALIFFPAFFVLRGRYRVLLCLASSYVFYGFWDWRFTSLLLISSVVDYTIGLALAKEENPGKRKRYLSISIIVNLGILGTFKYFDFFVDSTAELLNTLGFGVNMPLLELILPVGISFYTFQSLSYSIDVYRGICKVERDFLRFAAYVALFPQLVAGPIVRARQLLPQLAQDSRFEWTRFFRGIELVIIGYALKLIVADNLAFYVDPRFAAPEQYGGLSLAVATIFFAFQIYGDFAGYSLIAIGLGVILGFDFGTNFCRPYFAASFSEFWRRWHISLSSWLRDYLYIPLGGNRHGPWKTARNLGLTMFLGGLWHGANWTFVTWGLLHGSYLALQHSFGAWLHQRLPFGLGRLWGLRVLLVFFGVCFAWVFFRANSMGDALLILERIATLEGGSTGLADNRALLLRCLLGIGGLVIAESVLEWRARRALPVPLAPGLVRAGCLIVLLWMLAAIGSFSGTRFIYFQF